MALCSPALADQGGRGHLSSAAQSPEKASVRVSDECRNLIGSKNRDGLAVTFEGKIWYVGK